MGLIATTHNTKSIDKTSNKFFPFSNRRNSQFALVNVAVDVNLDEEINIIFAKKSSFPRKNDVNNDICFGVCY